jgi:hypothetical protein
MSIVFEYLDEHKEMLLRKNPGRNESWLANEHMKKFIGWIRSWISQSSKTQTSEHLKKLAHGPIFIVVTYQGYDVNRHWHTYVNICVIIGITRAWHKKHHVEHKLSDIFEALRLSWI